MSSPDALLVRAVADICISGYQMFQKILN